MTPFNVFVLIVTLLFGFAVVRVMWHVWFSQFYDNPADLPLGQHVNEEKDFTAACDDLNSALHDFREAVVEAAKRDAKRLLNLFHRRGKDV